MLNDYCAYIIINLLIIIIILRITIIIIIIFIVIHNKNLKFFIRRRGRVCNANIRSQLEVQEDINKRIGWKRLRFQGYCRRTLEHLRARRALECDPVESRGPPVSTILCCVQHEVITLWFIRM